MKWNSHFKTLRSAAIVASVGRWKSDKHEVQCILCVFVPLSSLLLKDFQLCHSESGCEDILVV